ncbi:MAG TPA: hypothetical protein VFD53_11165, partial [Ilumatobacter sp.]|nr:hypothetical protein [Ilumatobacter sp.]
MTDTLEATDIDGDASAGAGTHAEATPPASTASALEVLIAAHGLALAVLVGGAAVTEILRSIVVIALTALVLVRQRRAARSLLTDAALLTFGLAGLMAGLVIGIHHTIVTAGSPVSVSGIALIVSGLPLVVIGVRRMVRPLRS